jgi:hypothetical protein
LVNARPSTMVTSSPSGTRLPIVGSWPKM